MANLDHQALEHEDMASAKLSPLILLSPPINLGVQTFATFTDRGSKIEYPMKANWNHPSSATSSLQYVCNRPLYKTYSYIQPLG